MADVDITKFELNPELEKKLHLFPIVQSHCTTVGQAIAERVREIAPVDSGSYRDSIVVDPPSPRKGIVRVHSSDPKASWIEFGTPTQGGHFTMRTAAESLGLTFIKKGS